MAGGVNPQGLTMMMYMLNKAPRGNNIYGIASSVAYAITMMVVVMSLLYQFLLGNRDGWIEEGRI